MFWKAVCTALSLSLEPAISGSQNSGRSESYHFRICESINLGMLEF